MDTREKNNFSIERLRLCQGENGEKEIRWGRGEQKLVPQSVGAMADFNEKKIWLTIMIVLE